MSLFSSLVHSGSGAVLISVRLYIMRRTFEVKILISISESKTDCFLALVRQIVKKENNELKRAILRLSIALVLYGGWVG